MPYVTAPFAAYLLTLAGDADVVVPRTERGYHPLCAVYTRACLGRRPRRLAERRLKMLELLHDAAGARRDRLTISAGSAIAIGCSPT